ncbi:MAG TPA: bacillithiol biosynthesis cysteine-adding enzyme BshC [Bryobacteraceae bacterium]|nr:bacillithiol biosynthesis cysteine-adding enzyme BshC [Bryobacteraceae bacterium]
MECTCVRHTELPHSTKLFTDLIYHFERVRTFYPYAPYSPDSYKDAAKQVNLSPERRAALVFALKEQNGPSATLDLLAQPGTVAVVTGQQVGLFSGPAYTIYKALTAARLAKELSAKGIPAVPIFWLATEDHDFAEVNHTWIFNAKHQPVKLEINGSAGANQPVGQIRMNAPPVDALRDAIRDFPYGAEAADAIGRAYVPGRTMGEAFGALLRDLLGEHEVLQIDPMAPAIRELAAPTIRAALAQAPELKRLVLERNRELIQAGYHAQVHVEDESSFFFLLENGRRVPLRRKNGDYITPTGRYSPEQLAERAAQISPNALLRPVVQDSILPTVAYIGGPAELAYLAQAAVLYRALVGRMPVAVNRSGFTVLDQRSRKLMDRYRLCLNDFFHGEEALRERLARSLVPEQLAGALEHTRQATGQAVEGLEGQLAGFDPTLDRALRTSYRKIAYQFSKIERKVAREMLVRDQRAGADADYLAGLIYPHKHLQERLYSVVPFLAKHGFGLIGELWDNIHLECPDHQLLVA